LLLWPGWKGKGGKKPNICNHKDKKKNREFKEKNGEKQDLIPADTTWLPLQDFWNCWVPVFWPQLHGD
jgi:hypothetical protein